MSQLSDEQINLIAERAAEKAIERMTNDLYRRVGKSLLEKMFWLLGVIGVGGYYWMQSRGLIQP